MEELFWDHSFKLKIYSKEIFMIYGAYKQANEFMSYVRNDENN